MHPARYQLARTNLADLHRQAQHSGPRRAARALRAQPHQSGRRGSALRRQPANPAGPR